ncbi:rab11 family-interacting protein 4A [Ixodes scapularis]|uniref:rab11 family-interacting protein 4A n=1 Tax=Ixodes scapularis TaxID=6945 RepID=UPI001C386BD5|nr:rab11 family-interacting protein 4A [Ixodes scapularis]
MCVMALGDQVFVDQLRQVFELCDEENCGYITADKLRELGREHFGGSEQALLQLVECLDPSQRGLISFKDFYAGVVALLKDADTLGSPTTDTVLIESSDEVDMSLRAESPTDSALPPSDRCSPVNKCGSSGSPSYSDAEERFECDGEEEDFGVMDIGRPSLSSDSFRSQGSGGSGSGRRQLPQRNSWLRTSLRRSGSNRKQSSPLGGEPFQSLGSNPTLVVGCRSSGCFEAEDLQSLSERQQCVDDLSDKVLQLQSQVSALSDNLTSNGDLYRRVKQENASLVDRIHTLEEQIRELEIKSDERVHEEERRLKDALSRQERETSAELDRCASRLHSLQQEQLSLQEETLRLRGLADRLKQEKAQVVDQLEQAQAELCQLREEHRHVQELARREREDALQQRALHAQLLQDMGRELEELRRLRTDRDGRPRSPSLLDLLPARCRELEAQLQALRDENKALREANEELQAQLLSSHVEEGRHLVGHVNSPDSLAAEFDTLDTLSKDKLIDTVKHEKEDNVRLRTYIDSILLNIIENHPQLLEVKPPS